jgi:hypothetical protein
MKLGFPRSRGRTSIWLAGLLLSCLSLIGNVFKTSRFQVSRNTTFFSFIKPVNEESSGSLSLRSFHVDTQDGVASVETNLKLQAKNQPPDFPRVCRDGPLLEPVWEWHHFGNSTRQSNQRILIASYSAFGNYAKLLELTSPINKEYAKLWNHDIVILQGTTMILPWDKNCTPPEERSRFNKIDLVLEALKRNDQYDQLLLLDADTLIYDFSFDISRLVSNTTMLVAQRTHKEDPASTVNLNNGITLWNLHHPLTAKVAEDWNQACREGIPDNRPYRGDQYYLRKILRSDDRIASISTVWNEFYYRDGTVIKHFQRSNARSWNETGLDSREDKIMNATREICGRFEIDTNDLDQRNYTTIAGKGFTPNSTCLPRRQSDWDLLAYGENTTTPASKRLLIAQYSSFGSYASLLEATAPLNKAYARKWNHDILIVQGTALLFNTDRVECEPPQHRAMYNKIPLLIHALGKTEFYDQVLILDADTLIFDFNYDITSLLGEDDMVAAHKVNLNDPATRTWNINNGITLWNLNHNKTQKVVMQWLKRTSKGLNGAYNFGWKDHGDQYYFAQNTTSREGCY